MMWYSGFWVILKITSANLWKLIYDIINSSTSICPFETGKCGKEGKKQKNSLLDKMIPKNISTGKNALFLKSINIFFSFRVFLLQTLTTHRTAEEGRDHFLFHSTTSNRSRTFRHWFTTLHIRWISHIFNRATCIYQTASR